MVVQHCQKVFLKTEKSYLTSLHVLDFVFIGHDIMERLIYFKNTPTYYLGIKAIETVNE